jgi:hypothetical protein
LNKKPYTKSNVECMQPFRQVVWVNHLTKKNGGTRFIKTPMTQRSPCTVW